MTLTRRQRTLALVTIAVLVSTIAGVSGRANAAQPSPSASSARAKPHEPPADVAVPPKRRPDVLGENWKQSADSAVITSGDATGLHVLRADAARGYQWRTVASLSEPGFDTDMWIGNMCVTGSGRRAVVAYAPRTFTNRGDLAERGAFTAVVDLDSGKVTKLPKLTSLAYFNPGCGPGETTVLTQGGSDGLGKTRLFTVDAATHKLSSPIVVHGQLTSPIPTKHGIIAADNGAVVRVGRTGKRKLVAPARGVPFRLAADADGGVEFMDRDKDTARVQRIKDPSHAGKAAVLATAPLTDVNVSSGRGGRVFITGKNITRSSAPMPTSVTEPNGSAKAKMSLNGHVAVESVSHPGQSDPRVAPANPSQPQPLQIQARSQDTGKEFTLSTVPAATTTAKLSPALAEGTSSTSTSDDPHDPGSITARTCSVPRNDARDQAMQPKPRQVEWAVDQAVRDSLTVTRPDDWKNLGMPSYSPQGLFPPVALDGGGHIPAQIMLGVAAQESNLWQAARFAVPGVTANPLISNYYGINYYNDTESDDWDISWDKADCGYGVTQVTDGMRKGAMDYNKQCAIALDFAANIAKGTQILENKWNQTRQADLIINDGDSSKIENWFFAVWAYNTGLHTKSQASSNSGAYGVGWLNNPINPIYPANRAPFLESTYSDAAHPQDWPYEEKVIGFAGHPIDAIETPGNLVAGYRQAWWSGATEDDAEQNRVNAKPPVYLFCDSSDDCEPGATYTPNSPDVLGQPAGPCAHENGSGQYDLKCWYHKSATWKQDCANTCGHETLRFDPGYAYQEDANSYPPDCTTSGLPYGALFIDDVPSGTPSIRPDCSPPASSGTFTFTFDQDSYGQYPGKVDVHQLGVGFGAHIWMSDTYQSSQYPLPKATGDWSLGKSLNQWARVMVHLPDVGARTQQALYKIDLDGDGHFNRHRYLNQAVQRNRWVSIGVYKFSGVPKIELSNITRDGHGTQRIAWDTVAIQPLPAKPQHIVAALGDSYSSGEGVGSYYPETDKDHGVDSWNACHRSANAWPRLLHLPGTTSTLGYLTDHYARNYDLGFVACSGADSDNVNGNKKTPWWQDTRNDADLLAASQGQHGEIWQIDSGVLTPETTLVTLTLGGNDNDAFSDALKECSFNRCDNDSTFEPRYKSIIDKAKPKLHDTISEIAAKAPNAQIILAGYPKLFSDDGPCADALGVTAGGEWAMNDLANYMWTMQTALTSELRANADIRVNSANIISPFDNYGVCDTPAWIHGVLFGPEGEGDFHDGDPDATCELWFDASCVSRESYHPTIDGSDAYSTAVEDRLANLGYGQG